MIYSECQRNRDELDTTFKFNDPPFHPIQSLSTDLLQKLFDDYLDPFTKQRFLFQTSKRLREWFQEKNICTFTAQEYYSRAISGFLEKSLMITDGDNNNTHAPKRARLSYTSTDKLKRYVKTHKKYFCSLKLSYVDFSDLERIIETLDGNYENVKEIRLPLCFKSRYTNQSLDASPFAYHSNLFQLLKKFPNIEKLNLENWSFLNDEAIKEIVKLRPNLTSLLIQGGSEITDSGLQAIAQNCTKLREIALTGERGISDRGLQPLIQANPTLCSLNLHGCREVSDITLDCIANTCPELTNLNLSYCAGVTSAGLIVIAQKCPKLSSLFLNELFLEKGFFTALLGITDRSNSPT